MSIRSRFIRLPCKARRGSVPPPSRRRGLASCQRGVAALEFALVLTPLLSLVFGFIAISGVFFTWSTMQNAAEYAAMLVATGQVTKISTGTLSSTNTTATIQCGSSMTSGEAEYYACSNLPSWASFSVTTTEDCTMPSISVVLSADASTAAIADVFKIFSGDTLRATAVVMKQGTCP